jgi:hypothetical protein
VFKVLDISSFAKRRDVRAQKGGTDGATPVTHETVVDGKLKAALVPRHIES